MPINHLEIRPQVQRLAAEAARSIKESVSFLAELRAQLASLQDQVDTVDQHIKLAEEKLPMLRCAAPVMPGDRLFTVVPAPDQNKPLPDMILLASDGSQINPSRHDAVEVGLINLGLIRMLPGTGRTPDVVTRSRLLYPGMEGILDDSLSEDLVAIMRDVEERKFLAETAAAAVHELAGDYAGEILPVVACTDGPLELFREPRGGEQQRKRFDQYLEALNGMAKIGAIPAGYVDKPRANLLVRMLEVMTSKPADLGEAGTERKYPGVDDTTLLQPWLEPGCRTNVFRLVSRSATQFSQKAVKLTLYFFYLNVGYLLPSGERRDLYARVEVPGWVAHNPAQLSLLHQVLLDQCRILGTNPYPYVLHRAHEIALVQLQEKEELMRMVMAELLSLGLPVPAASMKGENKAVGYNHGRSR
ncbi:MAG: DNA double-strand break repair nuclease NurA [Anaerolineae bacterium]|nr:DNA double-strand break repair nuclease NurA [Anaerolineae bacterium]